MNTSMYGFVKYSKERVLEVVDSNALVGFNRKWISSRYPNGVVPLCLIDKEGKLSFMSGVDTENFISCSEPEYIANWRTVGLDGIEPAKGDKVSTNAKLCLSFDGEQETILTQVIRGKDIYAIRGTHDDSYSICELDASMFSMPEVIDGVLTFVYTDKPSGLRAIHEKLRRLESLGWSDVVVSITPDVSITMHSSKTYAIDNGRIQDEWGFYHAVNRLNVLSLLDMAIEDAENETTRKKVYSVNTKTPKATFTLQIKK